MVTNLMPHMPLFSNMLQFYLTWEHATVLVFLVEVLNWGCHNSDDLLELGAAARLLSFGYLLISYS